ncbi:hypothetical protein BB559_001894 [Furculomyces boomerangus]|uniref:Programmed cell death protein 5 n=1 Tax=Furculomyces boomerangus TaxID=61424 RepID=A0A2T9YZL7_9FUNG|nr:hypothetical protein BB559_001894 [Furculomyces boomerangus]
MNHNNQMNLQNASEVNNESDQAAIQKNEAREEMLSRVLTTDAKERLGRIALVKAEKAKQVGDMLIQMASRGQIARKVTEDELKDLLEKITGSNNQTKIVYNRKNIDSSDEDEYDL